MKKLFIIAAAALVASVACSKVETVATPDQEIGFQVASYLSQTKADSHGGHTSFVNELTEVGAASNYFKSIAYIHAAQADGTVAAPAKFFTAAGESGIETISYDGSSTWKPAHPYYWPKSPKSSISFFSWYDFEDQVTPTISGYATDGAAVTLAWADRTVALKDNVMYADAAYHYKKNDNGTQNHTINASEGVPTLFHHALAKVRFTIAQNPMKEQDGTSDYYTFWDVTLSDVALSSGSIKTKGKLSLTETSKTTASTQGSWTLPSPAIWDDPTGSQVCLTTNLDNATDAIFDTDVARGVDSSSNPVLLTADAQDLSGTNFMANHYFTVLPQAIGNNVTLTFKYTIKQYYGTQAQYNSNKASILVSTETINVNDYGPAVSGATYGAPYTDNGIQLNAISGASANWLMNHQYVYNIIINPKSELILYDPAVADWEAEEGVDQTVPAA